MAAMLANGFAKARHDVAETGMSNATFTASEWPSSIHEIERAIQEENGRYKQRPGTSSTIYFPKDVDRPLDLSFIDGMGMVHYIKVDTVPVKTMVPLDPHVVKHMVNFQKVIEWRSQTATKEIERTLIDPRASVAELCFSYQPAALMHTHGILIEVTPHGLKAADSCLRRDMAAIEQEFWRGQVEVVKASAARLQEMSLMNDRQQNQQQEKVLDHFHHRKWTCSGQATVVNPFLGFFFCGCCSKDNPSTTKYSSDLDLARDEFFAYSL